MSENQKTAPDESVEQTKNKTKKTQQAENTQTIVIDLSDDTKALLREAIKAFVQFFAPPTLVLDADKNIVSEKTKEENREAIKESAKAPKQVEKATVSLTQIRELIQAKAADQKTTAIVSLLKEFSASNASSLAETHYVDFYEQLKDL
jgi:NAD(P)H-hydrate repair Nnr-like enzyme with NAD(P)H-hydrate dehydratase domain